MRLSDDTRKRQALRSEAGLLLAAAAAALGIVTCLLQLWDMRLRIPLEYDRSGDGRWIYFLVKTMIETGDLYHNPRLGFPNGYVGYDFPISEVLHTAVLHAMTWLFHDYGTVVNLFTIATYPACALTATLSFRLLGVSRAGAWVCGQLFAFLPFHFYRGQQHLFYAAYYAVPLTMTCLWWLAGGRPLLRWSLNPLTTRGWVCVLFFVIGGLQGVYQVAFVMGFLVLVALVRWARTMRIGSVVPVGLFAALLLGTCLLTFVPTFRYQHARGRNDNPVRRHANEFDSYGLRLAQLLLPAPQHRIGALREFRADYSEGFFNITENDYATLGVAGSAGLVLMALHAGHALCGRRHDRRLTLLFLLVASAIAVANVGGLGTFFAMLVTPVIRAMNRVSIDLAFLCLFALALAADRFLAPCRRGGRAGWCYAFWAVLLGVGLFDQTSDAWTPDYDRQQMAWENDEAFVRRIERSVTPDAAIFVLPAWSIPGGGKTDDLTSPDLLTGYLHSATLKWSNGHLAGRGVEERDMTLLHPTSGPETVASLRRAGFAGLWIDSRGDLRPGFADALVAAGGPHFTSRDGSTTFIRLAP